MPWLVIGSQKKVPFFFFPSTILFLEIFERFCWNTLCILHRGLELGIRARWTPPLQVLKRQQMAEAAEKRLKEQESRGVKDPEKLRRQQQRQAELDRELGAAERSPNDANLRWQVT